MLCIRREVKESVNIYDREQSLSKPIGKIYVHKSNGRTMRLGFIGFDQRYKIIRDEIDTNSKREEVNDA